MPVSFRCGGLFCLSILYPVVHSLLYVQKCDAQSDNDVSLHDPPRVLIATIPPKSKKKKKKKLKIVASSTSLEFRISAFSISNWTIVGDSFLQIDRSLELAILTHLVLPRQSLKSPQILPAAHPRVAESYLEISPAQFLTMGKDSKEPRDKRPRGQGQSRDVQVSKAMSLLLRHAAEKEGLKMNSQGYANVADVVSSSAPFQHCRGNQTLTDIHAAPMAQAQISQSHL